MPFDIPAVTATFFVCLTLSLFVLGILADDADASLSLDDLALFTDRFYR